MSHNPPSPPISHLPSVRQSLVVLVFSCVAPMLALCVIAAVWRGNPVALMAAAALVLAGTLYVAWHLASRVSDSIELFSAGVRAAGDGDVWLPPARFLEEQHLGQAFRYTAARLQDTHEALRRKEACLSTVLNTARDAIVTSDRNGRILLFNRAAEEMFHMSAAEAVGGPLDRLIPRSSRIAHLGLMRSVDPAEPLPRDMAHSRVVEAVDARGEHFPVTASISCGEDGDERYYTAILRRPETPAAAVTSPR